MRASLIVLVCAAILSSCAAEQKGRPASPGQWTEDRVFLDGRINHLLSSGGFEAALHITDSLTAAGEKDPRALGQRARALAGLGRTDEAIVQFEDAILLDYQDCENHFQFATYLMKLGKSGRGQTEFSAAKQFCPASYMPVIYRNLAVSGIKLGKPDEALRSVEEGLGVFPDDPYLLGLKGMLISKEKPAEAESLLVKAQRAGQASPEFLIQYGLLLVNAGRPAEAVAVFEKALAQEPGDVDIRTLLAESYDRAGRYVEAEEILRKLLAERDEPELRSKLARVLYHRGGYGEALEIYKKLPPSPETMDRIAMCLHALGKTDEAIPWERRALEARPEWPTAMINLAVMLGAKGELAESRALLERVLEIDPENAVARTNLERLREAEKRGKP